MDKNSNDAGPESRRALIMARQVDKWVVSAGERLDILTGVDLAIKPGESVGIVGTSGSGKSTLLGLLAGLDRPSAGEIELAGCRLSQLDEDGLARLRARHVGFVFQSFQLLPSFTALENVMLPLELGGRLDEARDRARGLLARVGLQHRLGHYPRQLSGGEQQRVALARAFVTVPDILFADEPTGNLDDRTSQTIIDMLFDLNREHRTTLVLVTHDARLASRCDRLLRLEAGRMLES
ncbi:ABC transporter ATP-binding protein [Methylococcus capsulatus]|uniref:ABC transporter ATP-binding protein n=1 Tax=Methylococcus capsulatus TaxID=414 RepID=UPI001C52CFE3|nr:ABC transporter ATP-binding protein [Methylococcus capsulatus]QXP88901.1 ABC transporter ATP-binding protein [Methylococcus capsulatus]QXP95140.1 ABC transporter ATP-binding protein [Methylococcus capsulatus]